LTTHRTAIIFYFIFLWATALQTALAQSNHLLFHELNQSNGLSELQNPYIFKDSQGFVWIGSYDGLNRFDGKTIKVYRPILPSGKTDPHISSNVFEDASGDLWFTTYNGLFRLSPKTEALDPLVLQTVHKPVVEDYYAFHLDKYNRLWVVADDSLRLVNLSTR
jgi:ligand-binding sensor domain-containing protein